MLNTLVNAKKAIKNELLNNTAEYKGYVFPYVTPNLDGGLVVYADAIRGYGKLQGYDFSWIYDEQGCADANYRLYQGLTDLESLFMYTNGTYEGGDLYFDCYSAPALDFSKVTVFAYMFARNDAKLVKIPWSHYRVIDMSNAIDVQKMFDGVEFDIGNFEDNDGNYKRISSLPNLGKQPDIENVDSIFKSGNSYYNLSPTTFKQLVNELYDRASAEYSILTIRIANLYEQDYSDIAVATQKGWIISS